MKTRSKDLGTAWESTVVKQAQAAGLVAERLAEGGQYDRGDVRVFTDHEWIIECRNRQQMSIHEALEKALHKSGTPHTAVIWRRMKRKDGNTNRTQVGVPIVAMTLETFFELLKETVK